MLTDRRILTLAVVLVLSAVLRAVPTIPIPDGPEDVLTFAPYQALPPISAMPYQQPLSFQWPLPLSWTPTWWTPLQQYPPAYPLYNYSPMLPWQPAPYPAYQQNDHIGDIISLQNDLSSLTTIIALYPDNRNFARELIRLLGLTNRLDDQLHNTMFMNSPANRAAVTDLLAQLAHDTRQLGLDVTAYLTDLAHTTQDDALALLKQLDGLPAEKLALYRQRLNDLLADYRLVQRQLTALPSGNLLALQDTADQVKQMQDTIAEIKDKITQQ